MIYRAPSSKTAYFDPFFSLFYYQVRQKTKQMDQNLWQGSNNDDLPMGQLVLFCEKNLDASIFIIYRHIIYHSIANWMYFQNIEVSDPLGQPCSRKNQKKSKKSPFFAKDKCAPLKSPEETTIFLRIGYFYETPIFFDQFPTSHCWSGSTSIHVIHH